MVDQGRHGRPAPVYYEPQSVEQATGFLVLGQQRNPGESLGAAAALVLLDV